MLLRFVLLGNVYIADYYNRRIRKVTGSTGIISTIAGTGIAGYSGDNVQATSAALYEAQGVALDASGTSLYSDCCFFIYFVFYVPFIGNVYIADGGNNRIRKVTVSTGIITTIAGTSSTGYSGDNGVATSAMMFYPTGVTLDSAGIISLIFLVALSHNFNVI